MMVIRLSVLCGNEAAVVLYASEEFKEFYVYLEKDLT